VEFSLWKRLLTCRKTDYREIVLCYWKLLAASYAFQIISLTHPGMWDSDHWFDLRTNKPSVLLCNVNCHWYFKGKIVILTAQHFDMCNELCINLRWMWPMVLISEFRKICWILLKKFYAYYVWVLDFHKYFQPTTPKFNKDQTMMTILFNTRTREQKVKVKVQRWRINIALLFLNLGARWGGWSTPRPGRFTSGKDPVPIL